MGEDRWNRSWSSISTSCSLPLAEEGGCIEWGGRKDLMPTKVLDTFRSCNLEIMVVIPLLPPTVLSFSRMDTVQEVTLSRLDELKEENKPRYRVSEKT